MCRAVGVTVTLWFLVGGAVGSTVTVDLNSGKDSSCSAHIPCRTIERALSVAGPYGVVTLGPGTYAGAGNSNVTIRAPVTLRSSHGAAATIIDGLGTTRCLLVRSVEPVIVEGVTLTNGSAGWLKNCSLPSELPPNNVRTSAVPARHSMLEPVPEAVPDPKQTAWPSSNNNNTSAELSFLANSSEVELEHFLGKLRDGALLKLQRALGRCLRSRQSGGASEPQRTSRQETKSPPKTYVHSSKSPGPFNTKQTQAPPLGFSVQPEFSFSNADVGNVGGCLLVTSPIVLRDVTVANCTATYGGGLALVATEANLTRVHVKGNFATQGGGLWAVGSALHINASTIARNRAQNCGDTSASLKNASLGAGMLLATTTASLQSSFVCDNLGLSNTNTGFKAPAAAGVAAGGGVFAFHGNTTFVASVLSRNNLEAGALFSFGVTCQGAGFSGTGGVSFFIDSNVSENGAVSNGEFGFTLGGGVHVANHSIQIIQSHLSYNFMSGAGTEQGGGLWASRGSVVIHRGVVNSNNLHGVSSLGRIQGGGVYLVASSASLSSCTLNRNTMMGENSLQGGGLYSQNTSVSVEASSFAQNVVHSGGVSIGSALVDGGGLCAMGGTVLLNSTQLFSNAVLRARLNADGDIRGGGLCFRDVVTTILNCDILKNSVHGFQGSGGGVAVVGGQLVILSSRICSNSALNLGGPFSVLSDFTGGGFSAESSRVSLRDCDVVRNTVNASSVTGGGLMFKSCFAPAVVDCRIYRNLAVTGVTYGIFAAAGGTGFLGSTPFLISTVIAENIVMQGFFLASGAGLYVKSCVGNSTWKNVTLSNNHFLGRNSGAQGGGAYISECDTRIIGSHIVFNQAESSHSSWGGGLIGFYTSITLESSVVLGNTLRAHTFSPSARGAGLHLSQVRLLVVSSSFSNNSAIAVGGTAEGGGIWQTGGESILSNTTVTRNALAGTSVYGAGIWFAQNQMSEKPPVFALLTSVLANNTANGLSGATGGGVTLVQGSMFMSHSHIIGNRLIARAAHGAGVATLNGRMTAEASVLAQNSISGPVASSSVGGGLVVIGATSTVTLSSSVVFGNTAGLGAGIYCLGRMNMTAGTITGNTGASLGGAVFLAEASQFDFDGTITGNDMQPGNAGSKGVGTTIFSAQRNDPETRLRLAGNITLGLGFPVVLPPLPPSSEQLDLSGFRCIPGATMNNATQSFSPIFATVTVLPGIAAGINLSIVHAPPLQLGILECTLCDPGLYSLVGGQDFSQDNLCLPCGFGGRCLGGAKVVAESGYWGFRQQDVLTFGRCPPGYCCELNVHCSAYDECQGDRVGTLCGHCPPGMGEQFFSTRCKPADDCNDWWFVAFVLVLLGLYACYALYFPVKKANGIMTILIFYYQVVGYIRIPNSAVVATVMGFLEGVLSGGLSVAGDSGPGVCVVKGMTVLTKLSAMYLTPCIAAVLVCSFVFITRLGGWVSTMQPLSVAFSRLLLFFFNSLVSTSLQLLTFRDPFGNGQLLFFYDATITVPQPWQLVPLAFLVVLLPFPIVLYWYVNKRKHDDPILLASMAGWFREGMLWWVSVMLFQRFTLSFLHAIIPTPLLRGLVIAAVAALNTVLAAYFQPFSSPWQQVTYVVSLSMLVTIALLALPSLAQIDLATPHTFGSRAERAFEIVQFVLVLLPIVFCGILLVHAVARRCRGSRSRWRLWRWGTRPKLRETSMSLLSNYS